MDTTIIQVPVSKKMRDKAVHAAEESGFSSLQDFLRLVITKLVRRELNVRIDTSEYVSLSPRAKKRYIKIKQDIEKGRNITQTENTKELLDLLHT